MPENDEDEIYDWNTSARRARDTTNLSAEQEHDDLARAEVTVKGLQNRSKFIEEEEKDSERQ